MSQTRAHTSTHWIDPSVYKYLFDDILFQSISEDHDTSIDQWQNPRPLIISSKLFSLATPVWANRISSHVLLAMNSLWKVGRPSASNSPPRKCKSMAKRSKYRSGTPVRSIQCLLVDRHVSSSLFFSRSRTIYGHHKSLLSKCIRCSGRLWYSQGIDLSESRSMVWEISSASDKNASFCFSPLGIMKYERMQALIAALS